MKKPILFLILGITILLMACSSSSLPRVAADFPQNSYNTSPTTPTPAKEDKIKEIVVDADTLNIKLTSGEVKTFPYDNSPTVLINYLTKTLKQQPAESYNEQGYLCWSTMTTLSWGNFHILYDGQDTDQTLDYMVNVSDEKPNKEITITTPAKAAINASIDNYIQHTPGLLNRSAHNNKTEYEWFLEKRSTNIPEEADPASNYGIVVFSTNGKVKNISSPFPFAGTC